MVAERAAAGLAVVCVSIAVEGCTPSLHRGLLPNEGAGVAAFGALLSAAGDAVRLKGKRMRLFGILAATALACTLAGCAAPQQQQPDHSQLKVNDAGVSSDEGSQGGEEATASAEEGKPTASELRAKLDITEDYRSDFDHGEKGASYQKYIVLHDTEVDSSAASIVNSWESSGNKVASQFIVNKDGSIVQCVPMDAIAHHAGYGDAGHNSEYGVPEDGRDDKKGTTKAPSKSITDYGMNSYSIGIEIVHVGGQGAYPEAQLEAIDGLIAYIDAYYGSESTIIDHKMWRSGNSDTSAEFATYLANYRDHRTHN